MLHRRLRRHRPVADEHHQVRGDPPGRIGADARVAQEGAQLALAVPARPHRQPRQDVVGARHAMDLRVQLSDPGPGQPGDDRHGECVRVADLDERALPAPPDPVLDVRVGEQPRPPQDGEQHRDLVVAPGERTGRARAVDEPVQRGDGGGGQLLQQPGPGWAGPDPAGPRSGGEDGEVGGEREPWGQSGHPGHGARSAW